MQEFHVLSPRLEMVTNDESGMNALYQASQDPEMRGAYLNMLEEMRRIPGQEQWGCEWNILQRETGDVIGGLCFKGLPDENGQVELGYGIDEPYRCRGYAAEAVRAMADWALAQPGVRKVTAQTEPGNAVSQRVLAKCGFVRDGDGDEGPRFSLKETPSLLKLREHPEFSSEASSWFHKKWGIPQSAYTESMEACLKKDASVPQWYLAMEGQEIVGGLGLIENDFHDRKDLTPNVCAVYVEPSHRRRGLAGQLLSLVCEDLHDMGTDTLYLLTDHTGFYERYGWQFLCMVQGEGEPDPSRMYIHSWGTTRQSTTNQGEV